VLLVHGEQDTLIPVAHAHALHALRPDARLVLEPGCGHNDCPPPWKLVRSFLAEANLLGDAID
jgi:pimeloyl-ACP methyl ester carboxylesterase